MQTYLLVLLLLPLLLPLLLLRLPALEDETLRLTAH